MDVPALSDMIDGSIQVTRATFMDHVRRDHLADLETQLGYGAWLRMKDDHHVTYHRGKLHGRRVYFFTQSAIEYVFAP